MNAFSLTIPYQIQSTMQDALDGYMDNLGGRECILYFPPTLQPVASGYGENPQASFSNSYWTVGNPQWVNTVQGNPPYVGGNGFIEVETSGVITMVVYDKPSTFNRLYPMGERHQEGQIVTRGYVKDLPDVLNCTQMETYLELGTTLYHYTLDGEPRIPGKLIQNRYFYALWKRV